MQIHILSRFAAPTPQELAKNVVEISKSHSQSQQWCLRTLLPDLIVVKDKLLRRACLESLRHNLRQRGRRTSQLMFFNGGKLGTGNQPKISPCETLVPC